MSAEITFDGSNWMVFRDGHYVGDVSAVLPESVTGVRKEKSMEWKQTPAGHHEIHHEGKHFEVKHNVESNKHELHVDGKKVSEHATSAEAKTAAEASLKKK